jgi:hypothetical protein
MSPGAYLKHPRTNPFPEFRAGLLERQKADVGRG